MLLRSPQASIHWSVRPVYFGNPGRAIVPARADSAMDLLQRQVLATVCRAESDSGSNCRLLRKLWCEGGSWWEPARPIVSRNRGPPGVELNQNCPGIFLDVAILATPSAGWAWLFQVLPKTSGCWIAMWSPRSAMQCSYARLGCKGPSKVAGCVRYGGGMQDALEKRGLSSGIWRQRRR